MKFELFFSLFYNHLVVYYNPVVLELFSHLKPESLVFLSSSRQDKQHRSLLTGVMTSEKCVLSPTVCLDVSDPVRFLVVFVDLL